MLHSINFRPYIILAFTLLLTLSTACKSEPNNLGAQAHAIAQLAPAGRWISRFELRANRFDQLYDDHGDKQSLAASFDQINLNASIFPALAALGAGASLGISQTQAQVELARGEFTLGYGVTENLTMGAITSFGRTRTQVNFSVIPGNVGFNPAFNPALPAGPANFPFAPAGGGIAPIDTAGVQQILTNPAFGFEYKPIESTSASGLAEITIGAVYRFHHDKSSQWIASAGYRFGLSDKDDPDDLFDFPLDEGNNDLIFKFDYLKQWDSNQFDLLISATRTIQLADEAELRVPLPGQPLATAASKEILQRDLGDYWEYDIELGKTLGNWRWSAAWHRYVKSTDSYVSARGQDTTTLESASSQSANQWRLAASWSGIQAWQNHQLPLPLIVRLELQETYHGIRFPDVRDLYLTITALF